MEARGVLTQLRARMRAEVFRVLDDPSEPRPSLSREMLLINELIREYLKFHKYHHTESVLIAGINIPFAISVRQGRSKTDSSETGSSDLLIVSLNPDDVPAVCDRETK